MEEHSYTEARTKAIEACLAEEKDLNWKDLMDIFVMSLRHRIEDLETKNRSLNEDNSQLHSLNDSLREHISVLQDEDEDEKPEAHSYKDLKRSDLISMIESLKAQMAEQQREIENTKYATKIELEHLALEQEKMGKLCYEMLKNLSNGMVCVSANFEGRMKMYARQHYSERNRLKTESVLIETSLQPSEEETDSQPEQ